MRRGKKFRALLEKVSGDEEIEFIIPHPFLPPRYQELANNSNMILVLDRDMTLHVRWEGARLLEWHSITPGESRRIVASVLRNLEKYREEIKAFGRFVDERAEMPFEDPRYDGVLEIKAEVHANPIPEKKKSEDPGVTVPAETQTALVAMGGEPPLPSWEW